MFNDSLSISSKASKPPGLEVSGLEASSCLGGNREAKSTNWQAMRNCVDPALASFNGTGLALAGLYGGSGALAGFSEVKGLMACFYLAGIAVAGFSRGSGALASVYGA